MRPDLGSVVRFNAFGRRWFLRAPWHEPLFSERYKQGQQVLSRFGGWRITSRKSLAKPTGDA